jgi:GntR family transcriptional regulator
MMITARRDDMAQQQRPLYQQVVEDLRRQIHSGELPRGSQLPPDSELGDKYQASPSTVREAIKRLVSQGLVETRQGQGTFVARKIVPFVTDLAPDPQVGIDAGGEESRTRPTVTAERERTGRATAPEVAVLPCPPDIAERLRVIPGSQVISRNQERYIDDTLWSLQKSYYPFDWATRGATRLLMAEDIEQGTIKYLAESIGFSQAGYQDLVTARPADDNEQRLFGLQRDAAMFVISRTAFTEDGTATRVTVTVCPADRNQFLYSYGKVARPVRDQQWRGLDY